MCAARKRCAIIRPAPSRPRPVPSPTRSPAATATPTSGTEAVDRRFLQSLVGFNARMATLKVISQFIPRMAPFELRVVDFSILSLIHHNPGITDAGLKYLEGLTHLTSVDLYKTKVTRNGVAALQKAVPKSRVIGP